MEYLTNREIGAVSDKKDPTDYYFGDSDENRRVI